MIFFFRVLKNNLLYAFLPFRSQQLSLFLLSAIHAIRQSGPEKNKNIKFYIACAAV